MGVKLTERVTEAAEKDIRELESRIEKFKTGLIPEEKFKAYRLTRGVYGQRQSGVQMFRIKIPFGRITADQLIRIGEIAEQFTNSNLHTTTRQNIQLHYIKLDDTPQIWAALADAGLTAREACGNTVRTVTGSAAAGIDPLEPFDISPYALAVSQYFLRNPICQEMGRKFKMAFSSSEKDSAFTYFHDLGFIPQLKSENGLEKRGFSILIGGGLGAQSKVARKIYDFLPVNELIPFIEAVIRVFDRYGEREKRYKARLKFLLDEKRGMGLARFLELVEEEKNSLQSATYPIDPYVLSDVQPPRAFDVNGLLPADAIKFEQWKKTNVFEQKQDGFAGVYIKLPLGNISAQTAYQLAPIVKKHAADDIRITVNQGLLLRFVRLETLVYLFNALDGIGLAEPGFDTLADVTACPGTDTCNLAVTNSTGLAGQLENLVLAEFPELVFDDDLKIKISGCMNSCGQHMAANIGFHGSSIKKKPFVIPAMQVILGGGVDPQGNGLIGEKVIKLPTKRIPEALRTLLNDFQSNRTEGEYYNNYFLRQGKRYFFNLLKPIGDTASLNPSDYHDWGQQDEFVPEIGVGECAGVMVDVIGSILEEAREKLDLAQQALEEVAYADSIYHSYSSFVIGAKGMLLSEDVRCNTHIGILNDFEEHFVKTNRIGFPEGFEPFVLRMKSQSPDQAFAKAYLQDAEVFFKAILNLREAQLSNGTLIADKVVVSSHYKA